MLAAHPWVAALAGGVLIGVAVSLLLVANGRIAGISGIAGGLVQGWWRADATGQQARRELPWRALFLLGLIAGGGVGAWLIGAPVVERPGASAGLLAFAGVLVGYGTALGGGCTSGHGVCGLARLSRRSFVATAIFLGTAIVTTYVARHVLGLAL